MERTRVLRGIEGRSVVDGGLWSLLVMPEMRVAVFRLVALVTIRFGEFTAIVFSRMKPAKYMRDFTGQTTEFTHPHQGMNQ
jgi:hypothetical protein